MRSTTAILLLLLGTNVATSQALCDSDYAAGPIPLWAHISTILPKLLPPNLVQVKDEPQTGGVYSIDGRDTLLPPERYTVYVFDGLEIQANGHGLVFCLMFSTNTLVTPRGVRVGDSTSTLLRAYGPPTDGKCGTCESAEVDRFYGYCESSSTTGIGFCCKNGRITYISIGRCARM